MIAHSYQQQRKSYNSPALFRSEAVLILMLPETVGGRGVRTIVAIG
jgi:hypothetical protein